jgi:hypothetical protein
MATEPTTPATEEQAQPTQPEVLDLKVVIHLQGDRTSIGVHRPNTDPWIRIVKDVDLEGALGQAFEVLAEAEARWQEQPRFPAYQRPAPPPPAPRPAAPPVTRRGRAAQAAPAQPAPTVQAPRMF